MNKNTTGAAEANPISLITIIQGLHKVISPASDDVMMLISLINIDQYKAIREEVGAAFKVGELAEFSGFVEEETEFGDVSDVILGLLEQRFPIEKVEGKADTIMLTLEERTEWRDALIKELDEMVEQ